MRTRPLVYPLWSLLAALGCGAAPEEPSQSEDPASSDDEGPASLDEGDELPAVSEVDDEGPATSDDDELPASSDVDQDAPVPPAGEQSPESPIGPQPIAEAPSVPPPEVPPAPAPRCEPTASSLPEVPIQAELPEGVEFIPWEEFTMTNTLGPRGGVDALVAPLDVRSVTFASSYDGEDLVMAVATDSGDNAVVAISIDARTFRNHWPHFPCGDCQVSSGALGTALLTSDTLYGSSDGGYRYYEIAQGDFSDRSSSYVRAVDENVWVRGAAGWQGGPFDGSGELSAPLWGGRGIASVDHESGLEVTARYITRHAEDSQSSNVNVCATVPDIGFGSAYHYGQFVVTLCDADTVWVFEDFPEQYSEFDLAEPVTWVGSTVVASATGWYGLAGSALGLRVGNQASLAEGEQILGHVADDRVALRLTNLGLAVSQLAVTP
jgi:hypothetical protein